MRTKKVANGKPALWTGKLGKHLLVLVLGSCLLVLASWFLPLGSWFLSLDSCPVMPNYQQGFL